MDIWGLYATAIQLACALLAQKAGQYTLTKHASEIITTFIYICPANPSIEILQLIPVLVRVLQSKRNRRGKLAATDVQPLLDAIQGLSEGVKLSRQQYKLLSKYPFFRVTFLETLTFFLSGIKFNTEIVSVPSFSRECYRQFKREYKPIVLPSFRQAKPSQETRQEISLKFYKGEHRRLRSQEKRLNRQLQDLEKKAGREKAQRFGRR